MNQHVDALIIEAVEHVRDRFGPYGLRDMIRLAQAELERAEAAMHELDEPESAQRDDDRPTG